MKNTKKRKLCIIVPAHWEYSMGGAEYQAHVLTNHLVESNRYEIYHLSSMVNPHFQPVGYEICKIGNPKVWGFVFDTFTLLRTLNRIKPHTIYQQVGCAYTGIAAYYCKNNDCNLVWQIASDPDVEPWSKPILKSFSLQYLDKKILDYGIANAKHIVGQTVEQARLLEKHYGRSVTKIIRNFHPLPIETIDKSGPKTVIWVANIKKLKQPDIFIRLAQDMSHLDVKFVMAGAFQGKKSWCNSILAQIDSTPNIEYLGNLPQTEVNALIAKSHVLVNASEYEGFSNTFIQAWMRQVPVVSFIVNPDQLLTGDNCGFCADGDYKKFLASTIELIENDILRTNIGNSSKIYAISEHSETNITELTELF